MSAYSDLPLKKPPLAKSMACIDDMIEALDALQPDETTVAAMRIAELFPALIRAKERSNTTHQILTLLGELGLSLHPKKFQKLFNAELKVRNERGERYRCTTCRQSLPVMQRIVESKNASTHAGGHAMECAE
jgi:hypothetical protein